MNYQQVNLTSDIGGTTNNTNNHVVNPWGIVVEDDGSFWATLNADSLLALFNRKGLMLGSFSTIIPNPSGLARIPNDIPGGPTLVFVTDNGSIGIYQSGLPNPIVIKYTNPSASAYKGVAVFGDYVYVTNFDNYRVDVFDLATFTPQPSLAIVDADLASAGYGPFNVYVDKGCLFITYALVGPEGDNQPGLGNGYINYWNGRQLVRLANRGPLNSPWGIVRLDDKLYVGNFGDGLINVFKLADCDCTLVAEYCAPLKNRCSTPIQIDGIRGISLKNNVCEYKCGKRKVDNIWFTAAIQDRTHGLIGYLQPIKDC